ncbi:MAG: tRNA (adenosine(37)-N6)-threonylcarbamoyltransferase complex ATPase subunit type 1 TsaE [Nitratireductor sp.]
MNAPIHLRDEGATNRLGEDIALALRRGDALCLHGDLGAGKTCLARAIIRTISGDPGMEVPSPTYTLCQSYDGELPLNHFDLYRLSGEDELTELGFDEAKDEGVVIVEWPERAISAMPGEALHIHISITEDGARDVRFQPYDNELADRVRRSLAIRAFLGRNWGEAATRQRFQGDASARRYELVRLGEEVRILMDAPRLPDGPPIRDGKPYSQIVHLAEDVVPFVAIDELLRTRGFAAPALHAKSLGEGLLLLSHLGSGKIIDETGAPVRERYLASARLLAAIHRQDWPRVVEVTGEAGESRIHEVASYDLNAMTTEASLFADWYAPRFGGSLDARSRQDFFQIWADLATILTGSETSLVLRDYHSPNIIWRDDEPFPSRIGLIDFQDAMIGPTAYDVASLAQDARVDISPELERATLDAYLAERADDDGFNPETFRRDYAIMAAQRATKILGIFVRLDQRDGKPGYLAHLPRVREYLMRSLAHPALEAYRNWCRLNAGFEPARGGEWSRK